MILRLNFHMRVLTERSGIFADNTIDPEGNVVSGKTGIKIGLTGFQHRAMEIIYVAHAAML